MSESITLLQNEHPTRADALKNRAILLETALRLFSEHSVDEVSMSAIAEAAGLGKGTLYRHFQNKHEICEALLDKDQRVLQARTLEQLRSTLSPREKLTWFLGEVVNFAEQHRMLFFADLGSELLIHPAHWWWRQTIRGLLAQMRIAGDLDYQTDLIYGQVSVPSLHYMREIRGYSVERVLAGLNTIIDHLPKTY